MNTPLFRNCFALWLWIFALGLVIAKMGGSTTVDSYLLGLPGLAFGAYLVTITIVKIVRILIAQAQSQNQA